MNLSQNCPLHEKVYEIINQKKDKNTFISGSRFKAKADAAYDQLAPFMILYEGYMAEANAAEYIDQVRVLSAKIRALIDKKDRKKSASSYESWKSKILVSNKTAATADQLAQSVRPYSEDDFQFKKNKLFSREELDYLSLPGINVTNITTFKKHLLWTDKAVIPKNDPYHDLTKTFLLLIFLMSVYQISLSGNPKQEEMSVIQNPEFKSYYGFYDRSFVKHNDYGICAVTIFNDYWARIIYYYPKDINQNPKALPELWVFAHVEYFTEKGILIIKNFEDFTGKSEGMYQNVPVENFIIMKNEGPVNSPDSQSQNNLMLGYTTSYNRKKGFPYSTTLILIEEDYFNRNYRSIASAQLELKENETFWEKVREDRRETTDKGQDNNPNPDQRNTNLIAPLYYFLYHNSLSLKHFEKENFSFSNSNNPVKRIDDIPYIDESKRIQLISGTYRGVSLYHEKGENFLVISKLEIDLSGKVDMTVKLQGTGFVNAQDLHQNRGFIKFIDFSGKSYFLVVAMRYSYEGHYNDMLLNLEFTTENKKPLEVGGFITGTFSAKSIYTKGPLAGRIIFEKMDRLAFDKVRPNFSRLTSTDFDEILAKEQIRLFFSDPKFDSYSDAPAIMELRWLWNRKPGSVFAGEYWLLIGSKTSHTKGLFSDKTPLLTIFSLSIDKDANVTFKFDYNIPQASFGTVEINGRSVVLMLRGAETFTITFSADKKFTHSYCVLTRFNKNGDKSESYLGLIWDKTKLKSGIESPGKKQIFKVGAKDSILYADLITNGTVEIAPEIDELDKQMKGHLKFLLGTETLRMIRSLGMVEPEALLKFDEHRRLYFESAIFHLRENDADKAGIAMVKAFQQGFASLFVDGERIGNSKTAPETLKDDYQIFLRYHDEIAGCEALDKIVKGLWGKGVFEEMSHHAH